MDIIFSKVQSDSVVSNTKEFISDLSISYSSRHLKNERNRVKGITCYIETQRDSWVIEKLDIDCAFRTQPIPASRRLENLNSADPQL